MPINLGLASTHSPSINFQPEDFEKWRTRGRFQRRFPETPPVDTDTAKSWLGTVGSSFAVLQQKLAEYRPELLIFLGGDQSEMFDDSNVPNLMLFTGETAWGYNFRDRDLPKKEEAKPRRIVIETK